MVWALVHQDREIERHGSKEACVVAAFERGWVMRSRSGLFLLEGVTLRPVPDVDCEGADDPEERCPRHPKDCTCWQTRHKDHAHG